MTSRTAVAFALALHAYFMPAMAQRPEAKVQPGERIKFYETEAAALTPAEIYEELERQRTISAIKRREGQGLFAMDEDSLKTIGYAQALKQKRATNDPTAAFHYGMHNLRICGGFQSIDTGQLADAVRSCFLESLESFKLASGANMGAASFNVAKFYELGWGVLPSKLVAADWFVKAANQHLAVGSPDEALTSVEAALNLMPDHPPALRLRAVLLR